MRRGRRALPRLCPAELQGCSWWRHSDSEWTSFLLCCRDALLAPFKPGGPPGGIAYTISAASQQNIIAVFSRAMRPGTASGSSLTNGSSAETCGNLSAQLANSTAVHTPLSLGVWTVSVSMLVLYDTGLQAYETVTRLQSAADEVSRLSGFTFSTENRATRGFQPVKGMLHGPYGNCAGIS
jgi:hypothetical protein